MPAKSAEGMASPEMCGCSFFCLDIPISIGTGAMKEPNERLWRHAAHNNLKKRAAEKVKTEEKYGVGDII